MYSIGDRMIYNIYIYIDVIYNIYVLLLYIDVTNNATKSHSQFILNLHPLLSLYIIIFNIIYIYILSLIKHYRHMYIYTHIHVQPRARAHTHARVHGEHTNIIVHTSLIA